MANGIVIGMTMKLTIDGAGRIVIPHVIRRQFHLERGSRLDQEVQQDAIVLRPQTCDATLVEENGLLIHEGQPAGNLIDAVERARRKRDLDVTGNGG